MKTPLVTIYIPTYNRVLLLKRAVNSVLTQTYENLEVIIVDDKSSDLTANYLEEISRTDSRVRFLINDENSGACFSRNRAINNATGEFITGLDDDDYFLENRILNFVRYWKKKNIESIVLYSMQYIKTTENKLCVVKKPKKTYKKKLFVSNFIGNQVFTRTRYIRNINGFDEKLHAWQDLDCWLSLLNSGIAERTNYIDYIIDTSHPHERISKNIKNIESAYTRIIDKHNPSKKEKNRLHVQLLSYKAKINTRYEILKSLKIYDIQSILTIIKISLNRH